MCFGTFRLTMISLPCVSFFVCLFVCLLFVFLLFFVCLFVCFWLNSSMYKWRGGRGRNRWAPFPPLELFNISLCYMFTFVQRETGERKGGEGEGREGARWTWTTGEGEIGEGAKRAGATGGTEGVGTAAASGEGEDLAWVRWDQCPSCSGWTLCGVLQSRQT